MVFPPLASLPPSLPSHGALPPTAAQGVKTPRGSHSLSEYYWPITRCTNTPGIGVAGCSNPVRGEDTVGERTSRGRRRRTFAAVAAVGTLRRRRRGRNGLLPLPRSSSRSSLPSSVALAALSEIDGRVRASERGETRTGWSESEFCAAGIKKWDAGGASFLEHVWY